MGRPLFGYLVRDLKYSVINVDKLTYAGNLESVGEVDQNPGYTFEQLDICDAPSMARVFAEHHPGKVMHLAAESHVDRSIDGPGDFIKTNVNGTFNLLEAARQYFGGLNDNEKQHSVFTTYLQMKYMVIWQVQMIYLQKKLRIRHHHLILQVKRRLII